MRFLSSSHCMTNEKISFFQEDTSYRILHKKNIKTKIIDMCVNEGCRVGEINIVVCSDTFLRKMNVEHLNHDYNTDIITFDYCETKSEIIGDLFISIDTVRYNSKEYKVSIYNELLRVILHGVLHLIGFNDKSDQEQVLMTSKENQYLKMFD